MKPAGLTCSERRELENLIHGCIHAITSYSTEAANIARDRRHEGEKAFSLLREEYAEAKTRLETLRECLGIHARFHGCQSRSGQDLPPAATGESSELAMSPDSEEPSQVSQ